MIKNELCLGTTQTEGSIVRMIFFNKNLHTELASYPKKYKTKLTPQTLFYIKSEMVLSQEQLHNYFLVI